MTAINVRHPDKLFIDGRWVAPQGGRIEIISPSTEQVVATVAEANAADVDAAVQAARRAFDSGVWSNLDVAKRSEMIGRIGAELEQRSAELAAAWTQQVGALATGAPFMVGAALFVTKFYAGLDAKQHLVEQVKPTDGRGAAIIAREPSGVVAAIAPWNAPLIILINKVIPALLAGCTVIMKPAPEAPLEAYLIAEAAEAAGLPAGVLNLVTAHREASEVLVRHPGVDKVSFTGSTVAGKRIASLCGERIARCTLELGGKSA
ncbi:MAG: hypothetical protein RLZZ393_291, partial [Pseudomonadota bacterium]